MQVEIFADSLTPSCGPQGILPRVIFLKEWRQRAKLTGEALGAMLDPPASAGTISAYETGARNIGPERLVQLAHALGTTPGKILDEPPPLEGSSRVVTMPGEVIDLWGVLSPHARKQALALLKAIAETDESDSDQAQS
jgi:transcriptional regulator with XRE-family HTH domain